MRLIGLCGRKRSGKDSVGRTLGEFGFVRLAFADRLKALAADVFGVPRDLFEDDALKEVVLPASKGAGWWGRCKEAAYAYDGEMLLLFPPGILKTRPSEHMRALLDTMRAKWPDGVSPRIIAQQVGTEWGRELWPEVWTSWALGNACRLRDGGCIYHRSAGTCEDAPRMSPPAGVVITDTRFRNEIDLIRQGKGRVWWIDAESRLPPWRPEHASEPDPREMPGFCDDVVSNNGSRDSLAALVVAKLTLPVEKGGPRAEP